MTNRRITTTIGLRYEDAAKVGVIVEAVREMLKNHRPLTSDKPYWFISTSLLTLIEYYGLLLYQNHGMG